MSKIRELTEQLKDKALEDEEQALPSRTYRSRGSYVTGDSTRQRVIQVAVREINRVGYAKATSSAIAKRAKVSWGVIQYHFGSKLGLDYGVVLEGMASMERQLKNLQIEGEDRRGRVERLVEELFDIMCSDLSRAAGEVLLNLRYKAANDRSHVAKLIEMSREMEQLLVNAFERAVCKKINPALSSTAMSVLRGFNVSTWTLPGPWTYRKEKAMLITMILAVVEDVDVAAR